MRAQAWLGTCCRVMRRNAVHPLLCVPPARGYGAGLIRILCPHCFSLPASEPLTRAPALCKTLHADCKHFQFWSVVSDLCPLTSACSQGLSIPGRSPHQEHECKDADNADEREDERYVHEGSFLLLRLFIHEVKGWQTVSATCFLLALRSVLREVFPQGWRPDQLFIRASDPQLLAVYSPLKPPLRDASIGGYSINVDRLLQAIDPLYHLISIRL